MNIDQYQEQIFIYGRRWTAQGSGSRAENDSNFRGFSTRRSLITVIMQRERATHNVPHVGK